MLSMNPVPRSPLAPTAPARPRPVPELPESCPSLPFAPTHGEEPGPFEPGAVFAAGLRHHHLANTAYPIAHRKTIWRRRRPQEEYRDLLAAAVPSGEDLCLYAHLPFCERRCTFCEYCVLPTHDEEQEARYHVALLRELDLYLDLLGPRHRLLGFDIGGGTPALVRPERVGELVDRVTGRLALAPGFDISIETTPKVAARWPDRIAALRWAGIERISMGLQTASPRLLERYGRGLQRVDLNRRAVDAIRAAGFDRLNVDLMYGLAGQRPEDFRHTLRQAIALGPEYVTLYRMRYKGTRVAGEAALVGLELVQRMYRDAHRLLAEAGYRARWGKNAFSRVDGDPGTSAYLTQRVVHGTPYLGLGLGAQSYTGQLLSYNLGAASKRMERYLASVDRGRLPIQDLYHLPLAEGLAKMLSVSFYFGAIHLPAVRERFGVDLRERFGAELGHLLERDLLRFDGPDDLRMTRAGAEQFNGVVALFYSRAVQAHLLSL